MGPAVIAVEVPIVLLTRPLHWRPTVQTKEERGGRAAGVDLEPPSHPQLLRRLRSEAGTLQTHFGRLLERSRARLSGPAEDRVDFSEERLSSPQGMRSNSAPGRMQLDPNVELVMRALLPGAGVIPRPDLVGLVRQVSQHSGRSHGAEADSEDGEDFSELASVNEEEDARQEWAFQAAFDGAAFDWSVAGSLPSPQPDVEEVPRAVLTDVAAQPAPDARCAICLQDVDQLILQCQHSFCAQCLSEQLAARWPGPRVVFSYLQCALCRAPLEHESLVPLLVEHQELQQRVAGIALRKFIEDGLDEELNRELGRPAADEEMRARAEGMMAVYSCFDCEEPFCGGRVDCAQEQDLEQAQLRCHQCEWEALATVDDLRCMVHGHRFAIFKCGSCCDLAVWDCGFAHFCERCHNEHNSDGVKEHPCPGPERCPLGLPHPRNNIRDRHRPFVAGCTGCLGFAFEHDQHVGGGGHGFGYPKRDWFSYASGGELLAAIGEEEVRGRLRGKPPPIPRGGCAAECAERLLLCEQGISSAALLLEAAGGGQLCSDTQRAKVLRQRLVAVGLSGDGKPLECASRLLLLLRAEGPQAILALEAREAAWDASRAAARAAREVMMRPGRRARSERQKLAMEYFLKRDNA